MVDFTPNTPKEDPFATPAQARLGFLERRRRKVIAEIERNRRGEHRVPTWLLATILVVFVAAWAAFVIFV